ncbi:MAG: SIR2 family protein, partial [Methylobacter sp.]|nr:SIR2 family protein [Methylobacter sp.]
IGLSKIKNKIADFSNIKNIHFLLGAGASADSIPDMKKMLDAVDVKLRGGEGLECLDASFAKIRASSAENLESILGTLYSYRSYLEGTGTVSNENSNLIDLIEKVIFDQINIDLDSSQAEKSLKLYKRLYQKLSLRNKDLARVNVFTTNNDLLSEKALDYLNINYNNGFGGGLNRVFNPARFSYTFSKKVDTSLEKYEPLENMVYLYKLHGSISWVECSDNSFFNIKEVQVIPKDGRPDGNVLIYPTPLKQNKSLGSPYADLIREFQRKLLLPHGVLFVIGYSFSDEHINNAIYQALATNSSISIVIFGNYSDKAIFKVEDRRIYKIFGEIEKDTSKENIHYFNYIVNEIIPDLDDNRDTDLLKEFVNNIKELNNFKRIDTK